MKAEELGNEEVTCSDRISDLPDDLLFRILSLVPVRIALSTSLLSKRWNYVRKMMPTLMYDESCPYNGSLGFDQFCVMSLSLHEAPVLKTLYIKLTNQYDSIDTLLFPNIRSTLLKIKITLSSGYHSPIRFPNNLNVFKTLLVLKLHGNFVLSFVDSPVCFPSLKRLQLTCVNFRCEKSFEGILSACPALEDLILHRLCGLGRFLFSISSPSLQRLSITTLGAYYYYDATIHKISAPSLEYLKIFDDRGCYNFVGDMPKLVEADVKVHLSKIKKLRKFLSSLERLSIRLYPAIILNLTDSLIFNRLLHLELGYSFYSNLLLGLLKYFPNLRSLKLVQPYLTVNEDQLYCLVSVPECLSFNLENLQWSGYGGTLNEREAAVYILKNAHFLKTATISLQKTSMDNGQIMMKDLRSISKASASCQLVIEL
uniref:F-box domain-containing protein n=1 Tax=Brassica campestris TaxID=3711 RepID=M4CRL5_BRACM